MNLTGYLFILLAPMAFSGMLPVEPQPFSLAIEATQQRFQLGSPVEVKLTLTNTSRTQISLLDTNRACDFQLEVRDSHGQLAPETKAKRDLNCGAGFIVMVGRRILRALKPGDSYEDVMFVNQFYELTRPDDYYIQVTRKIPKELGKGTVKSNAITVTVAQ
jgi:hypothetical protein